MVELDCWHIQNPKRFERERRLVNEQYPELIFDSDGDQVVLRGPLRVSSDLFQIEIWYPTNFPDQAPTLFESSGKIPRTPDRHINANGSCCVCVEPEMGCYFEFGKSSTVDYINSLAIPFFSSQVYFEQFGEWPFGEYAHGKAGIIESYQKITGISRQGLIVRLLRMAFNPKEEKNKCPCGSGRRAGKCHGDVIKTLRRQLPRETIERHIELLRPSSENR